MQDYEKLGVFYLGREYDLEARKATDDLVLYDSKDLVTHAVVLGMTGSGKTGLCVGLIEEAAIDGVPAIIIDPKGDLGNLLLTFPDLRPEDFLPWINEDDARRQGLSPEEYAAQQAQQWQKGLASWGQDGGRIRRLRESADFRIYTPASGAGVPVSILKSFAAPPPEALDDAEWIRERVATTVTGLLGLVGIDADPVQSREFILLATIVDAQWRQGRDLDLAQLILQVQNPPVTRIGVLDLESFYPAKDRFALVMALNNLLASPGFSAWLEGEPLDIQSILYTPAGRPRVAIFSIAHLNDAQRMFFVSLLLNQVLGWMRAQPGTSSLRALLYIDEIAGYLPPLGNPPSKPPLLTLLKQGRAIGLGVVLATQNPVDLDYKALGNAGTWFIGRLQTARDKERVLDGLEGAAATGGGYRRQDFDRILSGLGSRVFLLNNARDDAPVVMTTRWALSYLRGPLTREQIRSLMAAQPAAEVEARAAAPAPVTPSTAPAAAGGEMTGAPPAVPPEIQQVYLPARGLPPAGSALVYRPKVLGAARVAYASSKARVSTVVDCLRLAEVHDGPVPLDWAESEPVEIDIRDLGQRPAAAAEVKHAPLPPAAGAAKNYAAWKREFTNWVYAAQALDLLYSPSLKQYAQVGESERDFRARLGLAAREQRDAAVEKLRAKYAPKLAALQEKKRRAEQALRREKEQASQAGLQTVLSVGATLLGAFTGRKIASSGNVSRAASAARGLSKTSSERADIARAEETLAAVQKQLADLEAQFQAETAALAERIDPSTEALETLSIRPKKADITVQIVALAWAPYWQDEAGKETPAW